LVQNFVIYIWNTCRPFLDYQLVCQLKRGMVPYRTIRTLLFVGIIESMCITTTGQALSQPHNRHITNTFPSSAFVFNRWQSASTSKISHLSSTAARALQFVIRHRDTSVSIIIYRLHFDPRDEK
jgi:hypothetical protein